MSLDITVIYLILQLIKDDLWPNPLQYFLVPEVDEAAEGGLDEDGGSDVEDLEEADDAGEENED